MEFLTGMLMGIAVIGSLVRLELIEEETGQKRLVECSRGRYSRKSLETYINKNVEIEFEWGDKQRPKLLRVSFPSPTVSI